MTHTDDEKAAEEYWIATDADCDYDGGSAYSADALMKAFTAGISHARRWIPVSTPPTESGWVYGFFPSLPKDLQVRLSHYNLDRRKFECAFFSQVIEDDCTHWFPKPPPPEVTNDKS